MGGRMRRLFHVPSADWSARDAIAALTGQSTSDAVLRLEIAAGSVLGRDVVAFGSARAALAATLRAIAPDGARVLVPAFTCVAVPNAIRTGGGRVTWIDVDGANLDLAAVEADAQAGDVVLAQHTYGIPLDPDRLRALGGRGVQVLEDRAHRFDGDDVVGIAAVYSLEHSKVVSGGHGGLVASDDRRVLAALRELRDELPPARGRAAGRVLRTSAVQRLLATRSVPGSIASAGRRVALRIPILSAASQSMDELAGGGVELEPLHPALASAGLRAIRSVEANRAHRRRVAEQYLDRLDALVPAWARPVGPFVRMPILVEDADRTSASLRALGIDLGRRWFDAPVHPAGSQSTYLAGSAPAAERLSRRVLSLPTHPLISTADVDAIASAVLAAA